MKKAVISFIAFCFIFWPVSTGFACINVPYQDFNPTADIEGLWMHREVRNCDSMDFQPNYPNLTTQDWEIGSYQNYTCGNRYYEHCIADGSFDMYYSETCYYPETGARIISVELLSAEVINGHLKASWNKSEEPNFGSYKLAISDSDDEFPSYPENYANWSSEDIDTTSLNIDLDDLIFPEEMSSATGNDSDVDYYVAIGVVDESQHIIMSNAKIISIPSSLIPVEPVTPTLTKWMHREVRDCETKDLLSDSFSLENPTYVTGKIDHALKVGQDELPIYEFDDQYGLNPAEGSIEAWVNPTNWLSDSAGYWEILSAVNEDGEDIFEFRRGRNVYNLQDMLQFVAYDSNGNFQVWRTAEIPALSWENNTWYHVAVTWSETSHPIIYLNGVAQEMEPAYGETTWNIRDFDGGTIYLGQRGNEQVRLHNTYNHAGRAAYDEIRVLKTKLTAAEIADSYNEGAGKELSLDDETLWLAHFDQNLEIETEHGNSVQDWEIGDYTNYTCGSRYDYQCIKDGTFDKYYSETCYYKETGDRITSITLNSVETDGVNLNLSWDKYTGSDFSSYSLAISKTDDTPNYPENNTGWYTYNQETTSLSKALTDIYYDNDSSNKLEAGESYYVVVTVLKNTGTALASNVIRFTMPEIVQFNAYAETLRGGFNVDASNIAGNEPLIITGTGPGFGPQIGVFDKYGNVEKRCFAYAETLRSGVRVATGDIDGDGKLDIITSAGPTGGPHIKLFNSDCQPTSPGFFALDGKFRGGTHLAVGDVDGDGIDEIIVGAGKGGGAQITVHNAQGEVLANFFAYDRNFRGGVKPAAIDINNDGRDEIVVVPESGSAHVRTFQLRPGEIKLLDPGFYAFEESDKSGASIAGGDVDGDGYQEIVVSNGAGKTSMVRVYKEIGTLVQEYYPYGENYSGGMDVSALDLNYDGIDEIITSPAGGGPNIRILYQ